MFDYAMLRLIWWFLLGVLLIGFAILDGFDFGVAMLLPSIGKNDHERRVMINSIGPYWEGNEVWFILAGGAMFAAWPIVYAVAFSGFYVAMFLLLVTFILRPVAIKFRSKQSQLSWRHTWDFILCISAFIASLIFGVAIANVLQGIPFYFDGNLQSYYTGTIWDLFNPFALLCGITSVIMMKMQGAVYLCCKTTNDLAHRAARSARINALVVIVFYALGGLWLTHHNIGYVITSVLPHDGPSNPLYKTVLHQNGVLFNHYQTWPWLLLAPFLGFFGAFTVLFTIRWPKIAMLASSCSIAGIISSVGVCLFPFILPSSIKPGCSLTIWDASASRSTLLNMLIATAIFLPLILGYTSWVYRVLRGKITTNDIKD